MPQFRCRTLPRSIRGMSQPHPDDGPIQEPVIEQALAEELEQHRGQWVAIYQERIVGVSDSAMGVKEEALRNGITDPLVFRVPLHPDRLVIR
jgi:Family of unknown function (DUF5678)